MKGFGEGLVTQNGGEEGDGWSAQEGKLAIKTKVLDCAEVLL